MTKYEMQLVISALRHKAHDEAGCSQAPDLIGKRDTPEWKLADRLEACAASMDRKRWTPIDEPAAAAGFTVGSHGIGIPRQHLSDGPVDEQVTFDEAEAAYLEHHLPPWAERRIKPTDNEPYPLRAQLPTKDGRRTGNAVIGVIIDSDLFEVTTDMGNVIMLNRAELEERFHAPEYVVSEEAMKDRRRQGGGGAQQAQSAFEPSRGVIDTGAYALAGELAKAVAQDDDDPEGHDMSAGLFGPNVSEWLRKVATLVQQAQEPPKRSIYDKYRSLEQAAPDMYRVLSRLTDAIRAHPQLAKSLESTIRDDAYSVVFTIRRCAWSSEPASMSEDNTPQPQPAPQAGEVTPDDMRKAAIVEMRKIPALANHNEWKGWPGTWAFATAAVNAILALRPQAVPMTPLEIFSHGPWVFQETGETFTGAQLDEAAFVKYRAHHGITAQGGEGEQG